MLEKLQQDLYFNGLEQYQTFFYPECASVLDYMGNGMLVVLDEANRIQEAQEYVCSSSTKSCGFPKKEDIF